MDFETWLDLSVLSSNHTPSPLALHHLSHPVFDPASHSNVPLGSWETDLTGHSLPPRHCSSDARSTKTAGGSRLMSKSHSLSLSPVSYLHNPDL